MNLTALKLINTSSWRLWLNRKHSRRRETHQSGNSGQCMARPHSACSAVAHGTGAAAGTGGPTSAFTAEACASALRTALPLAWCSSGAAARFCTDTVSEPAPGTRTFLQMAGAPFQRAQPSLCDLFPRSIALAFPECAWQRVHVSLPSRV